MGSKFSSLIEANENESDNSKNKEIKKKAFEDMKLLEEEEIRKVKEKATKDALEISKSQNKISSSKIEENMNTERNEVVTLVPGYIQKDEDVFEEERKKELDGG